MQSKHQILRNFTPVAVFSLLGSLMGIVVETSIAAKLGLSESSDAFYVAFTLPYILANLIYSTGQFSLVPFFWEFYRIVPNPLTSAWAVCS